MTGQAGSGPGVDTPGPAPIHEITIEEYPYFSTEFVYFAVCSCGRYKSGKHFYPGKAEQAGRDHVRAKTQEQHAEGRRRITQIVEDEGMPY